MRRSSDFRRVQGKGRRLRQGCLLVVVLPGTARSRIGLTVSRKVGGAVTRNRVKRWLREAIRHELGGLSGVWDVVLIAHPRSAHAGAAALRQDVGRAFARVASVSA